MKKILKYSVAFVAATIMVSCSGFLDEDPKTQLSESSAYSTPEALEAEMGGCYAVLHGGGMYKSTMTDQFCTASGLLHFGPNRTTDDWNDAIKLSKYSTTANGNNSVWEPVFQGISKCNALIKNIPSCNCDDQFKAEMEGEARFLRAWLYFLAVRVWGDVPLYTAPPASVDDAFKDRTAFYKVYAQILDDLTFAEANMRTKERQEALNFEKMRPYREAATAVKASVYLTIASMMTAPANDHFWDSRKDGDLRAAGLDPRTPDWSLCGISSAENAFTLAYENAEKVINCGVYSLADDYRQLFRFSEHGDWFLPEGIFTLATSPQAGSGNLAYWTLPNYPEGTSHTSTSNGNNGKTRPSRFGIEMFLKYDAGIKGTGSANKQIFVDSPDPRYRTSMRSHYVQLSDNTTIKTYPEDNSRMNSTSNANKLPFIWKYADPTYNMNAGRANVYLVRLAEMYLISAEASAQLGKPDDAIARVNELRERACKSNDNHALDASLWAKLKWDKNTYSTKEELVMAIWWERYIELSFEFHEYFDVHRYGATWLVENFCKPANAFLLQKTTGAETLLMGTYVDIAYPGAIENGYVYSEDPQVMRKSLLVPIPQKEMLNNPAIKNQNDFYWQ